MSREVAAEDLVVLAADKDMEQAMSNLLPRHESLGTSEFRFRILTHPMRDNGCRSSSHDLLRSFSSRCKYALVVFDYEGSGGSAGVPAVTREVESRLAATGWGERCCALVLEPELEIWMWTDSPELDRVIGWAGRDPAVREWLRAQRFELDANGKPSRPKEALGAALRHVRKQPSSSLFAQLARNAGLARCVDPAFLRLKGTLQRWFPR